LFRILDSAGLVVQAMSFDPWGDRLDSYQNEGAKPWAADLYHILETTRGFTGHEMVDGLDIVHMNGRIYDSRIARFLQAAPFIDGETFTQGYNRYSYVRNNPLNATDPSGHFVFTLAAIAITASEAFTVATAAHSILATASVFAGAGFLDALNAGATPGKALEAGAISGVSAAAFAGIGQSFASGANGGVQGATHSYLSGTLGMNSFAISATQAAAHGLVGGVMADLQGGKFAHGFAAAGLTKAFMKGAQIGINTHQSWYHVMGRTVIAGVIGGTISDVTGGKFANGAIMAAMAHALNAEGIGRRESRHNKIYPSDSDPEDLARAIESAKHDAAVQAANPLDRNDQGELFGTAVRSTRSGIAPSGKPMKRFGRYGYARPNIDAARGRQYNSNGWVGSWGRIEGAEALIISAPRGVPYRSYSPEYFQGLSSQLDMKVIFYVPSEGKTYDFE
jgi:RHS repeat-associated protein